MKKLIAFLFCVAAATSSWAKEQGSEPVTESPPTAAAKAVDATQTPAGRNLGLDYNVSAGLRTYPLSSYLSLESGYNFLLWGQWQNKEDVMYGYIRPAVNYTTALIYNSLEAKLTLKPVSFLGLHAGKMLALRSRDKVTDIDCSTVECTGTLDNEFVKADLVLAAGPVIYFGSMENRKVKSLRNEMNFYDDMPAIIAARGEDRIMTSSHTLGLRFDKNDPQDRLVGLNFRRSEAELAKSFSERVGVAYSHKYRYMDQNYRLLYLAGSYRSDFQKAGLTLAVQIEWLGGLKGLSL